MRMSLFRLVYHSRSTLDLAHGPFTDQVVDIIANAMTNNRRFNVTGGLIYDRDWFVQVLEGDRDAVIGTFERIAVDPRHRNLVIAESAHTRARRFPDWWMMATEWSHPGAGLFFPIITDEGFDPRSLARDALIDLVEAMLLHQAGHRGRTWWTTRSAMNTG
jgi:hypothetical protein